MPFITSTMVSSRPTPMMVAKNLPRWRRISLTARSIAAPLRSAGHGRTAHAGSPLYALRRRNHGLTRGQALAYDHSGRVGGAGLDVLELRTAFAQDEHALFALVLQKRG